MFQTTYLNKQNEVISEAIITFVVSEKTLKHFKKIAQLNQVFFSIQQVGQSIRNTQHLISKFLHILVE